MSKYPAIDQIPQLAQRQDSQAEQISDLIQVATKLGMYDAVDLIRDFSREVEHWKFVASYLASCHAATLAGLPKSAPKSHRRRFADICQSAVSFLRRKSSPPLVGPSKADRIEADFRRCEEAVRKYGPDATEASSASGS